MAWLMFDVRLIYLLIMQNTPPRWHLRFENFMQAFETLELAKKACKTEPENILYRMALIQAFEFSYELAWKTLKDFLNFQGTPVALPHDVLKQAFAMELIDDQDHWIKMLTDRNLTVHTYDQRHADTMIENITACYVPAFTKLINTLSSKRDAS